MVSHLFYYQLALIALVWLCLMLHCGYHMNATYKAVSGRGGQAGIVDPCPNLRYNPLGEDARPAPPQLAVAEVLWQKRFIIRTT
jgi:hypothetical protein